MDHKLKVLLCSPYYPDMETTTCGIANWTRNLYDYYKVNNIANVDLTLLPFDRSVDLGENSSVFERLASGIRDYLRLVNVARRELAKNHYDIVQISTSASLGLLKDYLIVKIARRHNVKSILHFHFGRIPDLYSSKNQEWKFLSKVLKLSDVGIAMDRSTFLTLQHIGLCKTYYLPNPISESVVSQVTQNKEEERISRTILFVGHVVRSKGVYELVQACAKIPNIKLKLVGKCDKSVKSDLLSILNGQASDWLEFVGEIPHSEVISEMSKCDIFVLPTYTEGFPNVILESMACGCSIVASSVGAIPEMLKDGDKNCGIVIKPQDSSEIVAAILKYIEDDGFKAEMSHNAYQKVFSSYTVPTIWNRLDSIWREVSWNLNE